MGEAETMQSETGKRDKRIEFEIKEGNKYLKWK